MEDALRSREEYSPTTKLVELPEGGLTISGYQGGISVPNPAEPIADGKSLRTSGTANVAYRRQHAQ